MKELTLQGAPGFPGGFLLTLLERRGAGLPAKGPSRSQCPETGHPGGPAGGSGEGEVMRKQRTGQAAWLQHLDVKFIPIFIRSLIHRDCRSCVQVLQSQLRQKPRLSGRVFFFFLSTDGNRKQVPRVSPGTGESPLESGREQPLQHPPQVPGVHPSGHSPYHPQVALQDHSAEPSAQGSPRASLAG